MAKKLLVFCGGHLIGGQEIVTLNYLKELIKLGIQIHCITNAWSNGEFESRLQKLKIPYTSVKLGFIYPLKPLWTLDTIFCFPKALKEIKKVIFYFQPDSYYHTSFRTIYMLQNFLNTKHILHVHENIYSTFFNRYILKSINAQTQKFIAVSKTTKKHLLNCGIDESRIEVLFNGTEIFSNDFNNKKVHIETSINLGIVGQIAPHKGHDIVIEALAILKKENIPVVLQIFGQGKDDYINSLKTKITRYGLERFVKWMGFKEDLDDIYDTINLLIVSTITVEPFGMGILEAGIRNIPTIASNTGGPVEIIDHNYNGWLFKTGDVVDLANKIKDIISQGFDNQKLIKNNYKRICLKFDIINQASHLKSLIFE